MDPDASGPNAIYSIESITYSPPEDGPPPKYQGSTPVLYQIIKDRYECSYRGEIEAKNKGMMKMYFVEGAIEKGTT